MQSISKITIFNKLCNILFALYRTRNKVNHLFVHLNLCIALALGVLVFIAGIESATSNEACATYLNGSFYKGFLCIYINA